MTALSEVLNRSAIKRAHRDDPFPSQGDPGEDGADGADGADGVDGAVLSRSVVIAFAAVRTLKTVPVTIIPAPGDNKFIQIVSGYCVYTAGLAFVGADQIDLIHPGMTTPDLGFYFDAEATLEATDNARIPVSTGTVVLSDPADLENQAVQARMETADPTVGTGNLVITLLYAVADIP